MGWHGKPTAYNSSSGGGKSVRRNLHNHGYKEDQRKRLKEHIQQLSGQKPGKSGILWNSDKERVTKEDKNTV